MCEALDSDREERSTGAPLAVLLVGKCGWGGVADFLV